MKICIDSGHCKLTPGKRSFDQSFFEYEFNYDVANKIKNHLERHGVDVWVQYVENSDPRAELNSRIAAVNKNRPDLVISIHANACGSDWNQSNGWEIYCNAPENKNKQGTRLAQVIHDSSINMLELRDRGIKNASGVAGIVTKTVCPAVLIEHGFYTNKEELVRLKDDAFREKCAVADAKGILQYLGITWKEKEQKMRESKTHWAEKHLDNLVKKEIINTPEAHRKSLDEPITKGEVFALIDRITTK